MELWICGKYLSGPKSEVAWDFQGIFDDKEKAIAACRDEKYFIAPAVLNKNLPDDQIDWPGAYYPLIQNGNPPADS